MIVMNLVTLKAAVKLELSFNKQAPAINKLAKRSQPGKLLYKKYYPSSFPVVYRSKANCDLLYAQVKV